MKYMNEETLKEAWELFLKERELSYSSNMNPWEMFKAGFIAGTKQKLNIHGIGGPASASVSEGEQLPAEGQSQNGSVRTFFCMTGQCEKQCLYCEDGGK